VRSDESVPRFHFIFQRGISRVSSIRHFVSVNETGEFVQIYYDSNVAFKCSLTCLYYFIYSVPLLSLMMFLLLVFGNFLMIC
jgi:hypothetical protein